MDVESMQQWNALNQYSTQFVASIPITPEYAIDNEHLQVAFEMYFGSEFRAGADMVSKIITDGVPRPRSRTPERIDRYGHRLTSTAKKYLTDRRHDAVKWCINDIMQEAGLVFECEAFNLFAAQIRQGLDQQHGRWERRRQGLIPDFMLQVTPSTRALMDVKTLCVCPSRYGAASKEPRSKAVEARQRSVQREYLNKARHADRVYNETPEGNTGPVERELHTYGRVRGLVAGAYGEMSTDAEWIMQMCARHAATRHWRQMGARNPNEAKAVIIAKNRRRLGIEAVRSHAQLKMDRLRAERGGGNERQARQRRYESQRQHQARRQHYFQYYFGGRHRDRGNGL